MRPMWSSARDVRPWCARYRGRASSRAARERAFAEHDTVAVGVDRAPRRRRALSCPGPRRRRRYSHTRASSSTPSARPCRMSPKSRTASPGLDEGPLRRGGLHVEAPPSAGKGRTCIARAGILQEERRQGVADEVTMPLQAGGPQRAAASPVLHALVHKRGFCLARLHGFARRRGFGFVFAPGIVGGGGLRRCRVRRPPWFFFLVHARPSFVFAAR